MERGRERDKPTEITIAERNPIIDATKPDSLLPLIILVIRMAEREIKSESLTLFSLNFEREREKEGVSE